MLYTTFYHTLKPYLADNTNLVLGLSGGLDSRVLLHLLAQLKSQRPQIQIKAVHVHHGLSINADAWLIQCQQWAQDSQIEFVAERVNVNTATRVSLEQAAREARYQALAKHINGNDLLLTAHHQGDQLETFLLALKRGSGPKGLASMAHAMPFAKGSLVRPLLNISREELQAYANEHQLNWVEDESNQDTRFDRNFIRHEIAPALKQRWPNIEKSVARSAALCAQQENLLKELLNERYQRLLSHDGSVAINELQKQSEACRNAILRLWLQEQGFTMPSEKQLQHIWDNVALAKTDAAPILTYGNTQIGRHQHQLYAFNKCPDLSDFNVQWDIATPLILPHDLGRLVFKPLFNNQEVKQEDGNLNQAEQKNDFDVQSLKAKSIQTLSLPHRLRVLNVTFSATGIHAHPEGRPYGRALKKLLQDWSIPTWQRQQIPFLVDDNELVAAVGLCVGQAYSGVEYQLLWLPSD